MQLCSTGEPPRERISKAKVAAAACQGVGTRPALVYTSCSPDRTSKQVVTVCHCQTPAAPDLPHGQGDGPLPGHFVGQVVNANLAMLGCLDPPDLVISVSSGLIRKNHETSEVSIAGLFLTH